MDTEKSFRYLVAFIGVESGQIEAVYGSNECGFVNREDVAQEITSKTKLIELDKCTSFQTFYSENSPGSRLVCVGGVCKVISC
jgi:hypothetical protein